MPALSPVTPTATSAIRTMSREAENIRWVFARGAAAGPLPAGRRLAQNCLGRASSERPGAAPVAVVMASPSTEYSPRYAAVSGDYARDLALMAGQQRR